jgi:hypothetical protein
MRVVILGVHGLGGFPSAEPKVTATSSPPPGRGEGGDLGAVGLDDGGDDGEAESVPAAMAKALVVGLLERLEKPVDLAGRDGRSGVADRDGCSPWA